MDWFKKHTDTVIILSAIIGSMLWMNGKFSDVDRQISHLEKEISIIKAVMIIKNILPPELAAKPEKNGGV